MHTHQKSSDPVATIGLDERLEALSDEIESLCENDPACQRLMTVPGIGPIISSAVVAAIGTGSGFKQGRDFAAWLGLADTHPGPEHECSTPEA